VIDAASLEASYEFYFGKRKPMPDTREQAIVFTMRVLERASDWQDGQDALANSSFADWLEATGDALAEAQSIIREAEERLGARLPY
jgi:hypothetical protein